MPAPVQSRSKHRAKQMYNKKVEGKSLVSARDLSTAESLADAEAAAGSTAIHVAGKCFLEGRLRYRGICASCKYYKSNERGSNQRTIQVTKTAAHTRRAFAALTGPLSRALP